MSILGKQKVFLVVLRSIVLGALLQIVRKHKHGRALRAIIFFPAAAVLFLIGWSLTWIGTQKQVLKTHAKPQKENLHLEAIVLEETPEITN